MREGKIVAASSVKFGGIGYAVAKMAFGNKLGVAIESDENLYGFNIGSLVVETTETIQDPHFTIIRNYK